MGNHQQEKRMQHGDLKHLYHALDRRNFLSKTAMGMGALALQQLWSPLHAQSNTLEETIMRALPAIAPKAKKVLYLFMAGGPSQFETFDYKPKLRELYATNLPDSIRKGQRLTGMSANQSALPVVPSLFDFQRHGKSGNWVSELLPNTAKIVDELCIIPSMFTEQINHDPAITFLQTGHQLPGRPSIGSWLSYGLGSENKNLPGFIVLVSKDASKDQPLYSRLWGNGFLPSEHQGIQFRSGKDPVLFLQNPEGYDGHDRREMLDHLKQLNALQQDTWGDPEINARISQYEMAFRMQTAVPEIMDITKESQEVFDLYGPSSRDQGSYAANCILARKLLEKDVRFVQLYHQGWDNHGGLPSNIKHQCKQIDQPTAALITDLKRRGMLEDTLVIWGGEFGRTVYSQGKVSKTEYGRDHHPRCFTMWMAGAGVKKGITFGQTDEFSYNIIKDPVHVHDFHATLLHLMGIDHEQLTYKVQGRRFRLTDVHGQIVKGILS
ncbi:MAG: hypothetical protein RLZZ557_1590 [Bacteroidota bacterium]